MDLPIKPLDKNFTLERINECRGLWDDRDYRLSKELLGKDHVAQINENLNKSGYNLRIIEPQGDTIEKTSYRIDALTPRKTDTRFQKFVEFVAGPKQQYIYSTISKTDMTAFLKQHFSEELKNDHFFSIAKAPKPLKPF